MNSDTAAARAAARAAAKAAARAAARAAAMAMATAYGYDYGYGYAYGCGYGYDYGYGYGYGYGWGAPVVLLLLDGLVHNSREFCWPSERGLDRPVELVGQRVAEALENRKTRLNLVRNGGAVDLRRCEWRV